MKALILDKSRVRDRINISEKGGIFKTESETTETLNSLFPNIVKNLNITRYSELDSVTAIFIYKDHPSILAIQSN